MPIRQPTPDPLRWWRFALMDPSTPRHDADPQPGFYARRYTKGGPLVPVEVRLVQEIDEATGELTAPERIEADELGRPKNAHDIWTRLRPVTRAEFDALVERHRTDHRMSATHAVYDVAALPTRPTKGATYA